MKSKIWLQITSARGPVECEQAVDLFYSSFFTALLKRLNVTRNIVSRTEGAKKNCSKSILITITADLKQLNEIRKLEGTVQWIAESTFRKSHKRKNWFIGITCTESVPEIKTDKKVITIERTKGSGPGGQHRNKVETAIRVTDKTTGICVTASKERSQAMNKRLALNRLESRFKSIKKKKGDKVKQSQWKNHNQIERGKAVLVFRGVKFKLIQDNRPFS